MLGELEEKVENKEKVAKDLEDYMVELKDIIE